MERRISIAIMTNVTYHPKMATMKHRAPPAYISVRTEDVSSEV
jgi:hypothetical protein